MRAVLADILVREGFGVVEASNGHEAIVYASALAIDVVVMDLSLPLLDGVEAARVLHTHVRTRHIPVIALTGYPVEPADRAEFAHVLAKPCLPETLVQHIRAVFARGTGGRSQQQ